MTGGTSPAIIRPATPDDYDSATEIWLEGWRSTGLTHLQDPDFDELRPRLETEATTRWSFFVSCCSDTITGMLALDRSAKTIDQIFVDPQYHGNGSAQTLLQFAQQQLPDGLSLWTAKENARARRFYEKHGFRLEEESPHPRYGYPICVYSWQPG